MNHNVADGKLDGVAGGKQQRVFHMHAHPLLMLSLFSVASAIVLFFCSDWGLRLEPGQSLPLSTLLSSLLPSTTTHNRHEKRRVLLPMSATNNSGSIRKMAAVIDDEKVLNVHVVPHTHDDVGWLKTVEQYYYGLNMTIQRACVKDILDSVIASLLENPSRTFTYVEQKFFSMWWKEQGDYVRDRVRFLIANGQLGFVNGGWCMHDEATTHFLGMIDQTTLGHDFLKKELGVIPKVGWQLDPFGHSKTQASLLTAKAGMDALYFGRIDYQDLTLRKLTQECEGLWSSSSSLSDSDNQSDSSTLFWGLTGSYSGNYGPPIGLCFDIRCGNQQVSLIDMNEKQLVQKINDFFLELRVQADQTKGNHIMLTMGSDFNYQRAHVYFSNLDDLIGSSEVFQQTGLVDVQSLFGDRFHKVNIFYSSPDYYTKMKYHEAQNRMTYSVAASSSTNDTLASANWSVKKDDFFPYSDCDHCFWTGYFTSRPGFKRLERVASSFLLAARQIEALPVSNKGSADDQMLGCRPLYRLEDSLGVSQHHDAVSGTAKQHVANDYSKRIQAGIDEAQIYLVNKLKYQFLNFSTPNENRLDNLMYCQFLNETICEVSQDATQKTGTDVYVVVYNALASNRSGVVRLPVSRKSSFQLSRMNGTESDDVRTVSSTECALSTSPQAAKYILMFDTGPLPCAGATVFRVRMLNGTYGEHESMMVNGIREPISGTSADRILAHANGSDVVKVSNGLLGVEFDSITGMMQSISANDVTLDVSQSWGYYTSFDAKFNANTSSNQNSGAYIFRPSEPNAKLKLISATKPPKFLNTDAGVEVYTEFEQPWIKQVTRVLKGLPFVEVEYMVGPVPIGDGRGKEVVTRFFSSIKNNGVFFTDSNGREFMQRKRNNRPSWALSVYEPVAGNYYPVNAAMYIEDEEASMSVLVDRSQGGASIVDGTVELMVQRRVVNDDHRGVGEPMNETVGGVSPYPPFGNATRKGEGVVIRGYHRIMVGKGKTGASLARSAMDETFSDPLVFVGSSISNSPLEFTQGSFSALQESLPRNVMLVTFSKLHGANPSSFLIRLAHQYGLNEDRVMSKPVQVDLSKLFSGYKLMSLVETTLTGNEDYNDWVERRFDWSGSGRLAWSTAESNTTIELKAMDIRTFVIQLDLEKSG